MAYNNYNNILQELNDEILCKEAYNKKVFDLKVENEENKNIISENEVAISTGLTVIFGLIVVDSIVALYTLFTSGNNTIGEVIVSLIVSLVLLVIFIYNNKKYKKKRNEIEEQLLVLELNKFLLYDEKPSRSELSNKNLNMLGEKISQLEEEKLKHIKELEEQAFKIKEALIKIQNIALSIGKDK